MSEEEEHLRRARERLARIEQENREADNLAEERRRQREEERTGPVSPVMPGRQPGKRRGWLFLAALIVVTFLLGELSITAQGYSGTDFDNADITGQATVLSCQRRGPLGYGFGYWHQCSADVQWGSGVRERRTFEQRNLLRADDVGTTVTIGRGRGVRGNVTYSRAEEPRRPLIVAAAVTLGVLALIPGLFLAAALLFAIRDGLRRLFRRKATNGMVP